MYGDELLLVSILESNSARDLDGIESRIRTRDFFVLGRVDRSLVKASAIRAQQVRNVRVEAVSADVPERSMPHDPGDTGEKRGTRAICRNVPNCSKMFQDLKKISKR